MAEVGTNVEDTLFTEGDLSSQLEFSINLGMLSDKSPAQQCGRPRHSISGHKARSLHKLLRPQKHRLRTTSMRQANSTRASQILSNHSQPQSKQPRKRAGTNVTEFSLQLGNFPSPLASFSKNDIWKTDCEQESKPDFDFGSLAGISVRQIGSSAEVSGQCENDCMVRRQAASTPFQLLHGSFGNSDRPSSLVPQYNRSSREETKSTRAFTHTPFEAAPVSLKGYQATQPAAAVGHMAAAGHESRGSAFDATVGASPCSIEVPAAASGCDAEAPPPQRQSSLMFKPLDVKAVSKLIDAANDEERLVEEGILMELPVKPQKKLLKSLRKIRTLRKSVPSFSHKRYKVASKTAKPSQILPKTPIAQREPDVKAKGSKPIVASSRVCDKSTPASAPLPTVPGLERLALQQAEQTGAAPRPRSATLAQYGSDATNPGYVPIAVSLKSTRSRQFLLNTPLGEFEVLKTLGQGSYGKVKLMRSALTNEQFAVKIIKRYPPHKHRRGHQEYRKAKTLDRRVVREANLAAILGQLHPHIVPLHDFRVTDTHFYLFYAFVNGVTLAERVGTHGLSEKEARAIFKPVVETINFCHQYSVIHRDIKLENVLIDYVDDTEKARPFMTGSHTLCSQRSDVATGGKGGTGGLWAPVLEGMIGRKTSGPMGKKPASSSPAGVQDMGIDYRTASVFDGCVKIIDFGLANFFDGISLMETFCGSLPYTAPEILRGDAYVGPEIDVWSLGVLLYVMLTGQFPFEDPAQPKNFDKIMAGDFTLRTNMSHDLQELLVRMLEPNAKRRISMQGILQHPWLLGGGQEDSAARPMPSTMTMVELDRHWVPRPGICCPHHPFPITDAIHDRRTLLLPGPHINALIAREVATCLDRSLDDVMRILETAMENGEPHDRMRLSALQEPLAGQVLRWPNALRSVGRGSIIEVANSPVVSVYALVAQQIDMRRYYLELPIVERADGPKRQSLCHCTSRGLPIDERSDRALQEELAPLQPRRQHNLFHRLSSQLSTTLGHSASASQRVSLPAKIHSTAPLTRSNSKHSDRRWSMFQMAGQPKDIKHQISDPEPLQPPEPLNLRSIGVMEDMTSRIALPNDLTGIPPETVLGLVSRLLNLHMIAHTFVETRRMPVHKALNMSMFSLKTIAAMMTSVKTRAQHTARDMDLETQASDSIYVDAPSVINESIANASEPLCSEDIPVALDLEPQDNPHEPRHHNIRSFFSYMVPRGLRSMTDDRRQASQYCSKLSKEPPSDRSGLGRILGPRRKNSMAPSMPMLKRCNSTSDSPDGRLVGDLYQEQMGVPDITTTVPVQYATPVIFAQYSPSLNRWRETEVVEYYSCSVRIELVRIGGCESRHRYALLIDRMTGHKGKFSLFRMFLRRMISALPGLEPEQFAPHTRHDPQITVV
ncbi:Serine/threonine-protein kinase [Linderina pennispora]|nr:Serine/threonine-protein kinase [Linderina pennispora]